MPRIHHVLVTIPFDARRLERLSAALAPARVSVAAGGNRDDIDEALETADAAFIAGHVDASMLRAPRLKWIHCNHAGVEKSAKPELFHRNIILTSSAGRSAPALAEHALMFMMTLNFGYPRLQKEQARGNWKQGKKIAVRNKPLCECTLGIIGTGHTGSALAARSRSLGMRVEGYRRRDGGRPEHFDHVYSRDAGDPLDPLLEAADFLVLAAPLNDETVGLMGRRELVLMKPSSFLVNIARGALIDEAALVDALDRGGIAGAGLDTFATEPLPLESPLWRHPKVIITPHARPRLSDREERVVQQLVDNIERYRSGSALRNQVSERDVYTGRADPAARPAAGERPASVRGTFRTGGADRLRPLAKRARQWLKRKFRPGKARKYPLRPAPGIRRDIVKYPVDDVARIDVFWKWLNQDVAPSISLFVQDYEVLRFDCAGPGYGHYHVADNSGFHRILLFEQQRQEQIERALFELESNSRYYLRQNPLEAIRAAELDPSGLSRACGEARRTLMTYAAFTDPVQPVATAATI